MTPTELAALPWTSFRVRDTLSKPDEAGWIFASRPEAKELLQLLKKGETTLKMGETEFDVRVSPGQGMFIQRSPIAQRVGGKARYGY